MMATASVTHQSGVYITEFLTCFAFPSRKQNRVSELKFTTKVDGERFGMKNNVRQIQLYTQGCLCLFGWLVGSFVCLFVLFLTNRRTFSPSKENYLVVPKYRKQSSTRVELSEPTKLTKFWGKETLLKIPAHKRKLPGQHAGEFCGGSDVLVQKDERVVGHPMPQIKLVQHQNLVYSLCKNDKSVLDLSFSEPETIKMLL